MSSFRVNIDDTPSIITPPPRSTTAIPKRKPWMIVVAALLGLLLIFAIGGYLYWRSFYGTPQYSLALLVDAAKRDDKAAVDALVDTGAVVDDFVPQIAVKAAEMYGKGLPTAVLEKLVRVAAPILPAVKDRAKAELPRVIRERSERFGDVPFVAMVVGADQYLDFKIEGDNATVKSKLADRPFEVKMKRKGDIWQIVGVRDEALATDIARKVGQELIAIATGGINKKTGDKLGVGNISDLLRQAEELVK